MPAQPQTPADLLLDRVPPQNIEAEMALLGSMLLEEDAIGQVIETIQENSFYKDAHKRIFSAILQIYQQGHSVDLVTLTDRLKKEGSLEEVGNVSYLTSLASFVPTAANVEHYARIVREKHILRSLIQTATQIATASYEGSEEASLLLDKAESMIFDIALHGAAKTFTPIKELVRDSFETIETLYQRKVHVTGAATGFSDLDAQTAGLQPSELIVLAGRPSMGKSSLAMCIAEHVALEEKKGVAIFSLEMSKEHLVLRMLCSHARVEIQKVRTGFVPEKAWPDLSTAAGRLAEAPIFIDDSPDISALELRSRARRLKARFDIQMIVVDYLQLMRSHMRSDNRQQEISEISRSLKALARELSIPVLAVSQLSRAPERREDFRPRLSDLRESGAIEQDADLVLLLFREDYYKTLPLEDPNRGTAELIIAKQRNGPTDTLRLAFLKEFSRFESLSRRTE
ncbi:MAG: replicative DNA helicase [Candidatus Omnitrophota bacterium]